MANEPDPAAGQPAASDADAASLPPGTALADYVKRPENEFLRIYIGSMLDEANQKHPLNIKTPAGQQPVLPATLDTRAESLLMLRPGANPDEMYALRLWPAPASVREAGREQPLWIGSAQVLRHRQAFNLVDMWLPLSEADAALAAVTVAVSGLPNGIAIHPDSKLPVLRVRTDTPAGSGDRPTL